jgi:hypothetical protein
MSELAKIRGTCVFCQQDIAASDPPEHIFPKWLRNFRPKGMTLAHEPGIEVRGSCVKKIGEHTFRAKGPESTTGRVCGKCNGSWMSDLEAQASPLLSPLIEGKEAHLTVADQIFISKWITKTMLMCQFLNTNDETIPNSEYSDFHDRRSASEFSEIFIGCYRGNRFGFIGFTQWLEPVTPPRTDLPEGLRAIMVFGCLVVEVAISLFDERLLGARFPRMVGDTLIEIWPPTVDRNWPPQIVLDDAAMLTFLDAPPGIIL